MSQYDSLRLDGATHIIVLGKRSDFAGLPRHFVIVERSELANTLRPFSSPKAADLPRLKQFYLRVSLSKQLPQADDFAGHFAAALLAAGYCAVRVKKDQGGPSLPVALARDIKPIDAQSFHGASPEDKYARVLEMVPQHLPGEMKGAFAELVSPAAIGTTVAILVVWAGSHAIGVGFAIDVLLLAIGFAMVGWSIFSAVGDVIEFFEIMESARNEADLNRAAQKLAGAIAALGVGTFIAILTRGAGRIAAARKGSVARKSGGSGGGAAASEAEIAKYRPKTEDSAPRKKRNKENSVADRSESQEAKAAPGSNWGVPESIKEKLPRDWESKPNKKKVGQRWQDPNNKGNGVRIDQGDPNSRYPSQQVDHVIVRKDGRVIGRDGKPIEGSIKDNAEQAHIPLSEYEKWGNWGEP